MKLLALCTLLALAVSPVHAAAWHEVGTQGALHFVVVAPAAQMDQDVYRDAVVALCTHAVICQVHFWPSDALAPRRLPMTDQQVNNRLAVWQYNGNNGYREFLWRCDIERGPNCL